MSYFGNIPAADGVNKLSKKVVVCVFRTVCSPPFPRGKIVYVRDTRNGLFMRLGDAVGCVMTRFLDRNTSVAGNLYAN